MAEHRLPMAEHRPLWPNTAPPMAELVGRGTPCLLWSLGVREVVCSLPSRGNSKESLSSNQETAKVFSPEMPFYSKISNILKYVVPVGSVSYRPSASPSYVASSHVKNNAYSGKLLLLLLLILCGVPLFHRAL